MNENNTENTPSTAVGQSDSTGLVMCYADLKIAIERMAIEINSAPPDLPSITMTPRIWLLWETVLHAAGVDPAIGMH